MIEDKIKLNFLAGVQVGNDIYFSAWNMNGLFKYNPHTKECKFLKYFSEEENLGLHSEAILFQNTIWFIPRASERIAIVNLNSLDISYLELPRLGYRSKGHIPPIRMRGHYEKETKFLWLIPYTYKLFLKIDMEKKVIVNVEQWGNDESIKSFSVITQNKIWTYRNIHSEIQILDIISGQKAIKKLITNNVTYMGIQKIGTWIFVFPKLLEDGILLVNSDTYETKIVNLKGNQQWYYEYQALTKDGDILLVPYVGKTYIKICARLGVCSIEENKELEVKENAYCSTKLVYNDEIWFLSHVTENPIICYSNQENKVKYFHIEINRKKYNRDVVECLTQFGIEYNPVTEIRIFGEQIFQLSTYLHYIKKKKDENSIFVNKQIGEHIYKSIR